jgi:hypothetical protein
VTGSIAEDATWLMTADAVRARAEEMLASGQADALRHFRLDLGRLDAVADDVVAVIRENYPDLRIPYHARWRHFAVGGRDRWGELAARLHHDGDEIGRIRVDLAVTSVLLDAGSGPVWRYVEPASGAVFSRSEGLAVASFDAFRAGLFSAHRFEPLRADADALAVIDAAHLAAAFQVSDGNPLAGLDGRVGLMRRLGDALRQAPRIFGAIEPRVGHLYDYLKTQVRDHSLPAPAILTAILDGLGPIWPARLELAGRNLGDVWRYAGIAPQGPAPGLVPFHKLSQWLAYSLAEVFEDGGISVTELDRLTGLPEYRNGGLVLDLGVLVLRDPALGLQALTVDHAAVVEWRALTVALLDRVAVPIRARLGLSAEALPLARILEGGTWAAGRKIARALRADGGPPLQIASDGTVF